jgi:hypothetical protein
MPAVYFLLPLIFIFPKLLPAPLFIISCMLHHSVSISVLSVVSLSVLRFFYIAI